MYEYNKSVYSTYESMPDGSSYAVEIRENSLKDGRIFISETVAIGNKHETHCISVRISHLSEFMRLIQQVSDKLSKKKSPVLEETTAIGEADHTSLSQEEKVLPEDLSSKLEESEKEKTYSLEEIRKEHKNAYAKWTDEEEQWVLSEYISEQDITKLAQLANRKPGGIKTRLKRFGIFNTEDPASRIETILNDWVNRDSYYNQ